jgi:hypothetical protein
MSDDEVRDLEPDPRATLQLEDGVGYRERRGVMFVGGVYRWAC